jgi:hypothetical protein
VSSHPLPVLPREARFRSSPPRRQKDRCQPTNPGGVVRRHAQLSTRRKWELLPRVSVGCREARPEEPSRGAGCVQAARSTPPTIVRMSWISFLSGFFMRCHIVPSLCQSILVHFLRIWQHVRSCPPECTRLASLSLSVAGLESSRISKQRKIWFDQGRPHR